MNLVKIEIIIDWPRLKTIKEIQSFLRFANFYKQFIKDYSKIAVLLLKLTKKEMIFDWKTKQKGVFEKLKQRFITRLILVTADSEAEKIIETNTLDKVLKMYLNQLGEDGKLHSIAYYLRKMTNPELNYNIHDKELLAIVEVFKQ